MLTVVNNPIRVAPERRRTSQVKMTRRVMSGDIIDAVFEDIHTIDTALAIAPIKRTETEIQHSPDYCFSDTIAQRGAYLNLRV